MQNKMLTKHAQPLALNLVLCVLSLSACTAARYELSAQALGHLDQVQAQPAELGQLIYRGDVYSDEQPSAVPAFYYERRVAVSTKGQGGTRVSWHITFDTERAVLSQRAESSAEYVLSSFEEVNRQTGVLSRVAVRPDGGLAFTRTSGDTTETTEENPGAPVVVGPTLFGFVLSQWSELSAGRSVRVRFAAVERMTSYAFDLSITRQTTTRTVVAFRPSSLFVRLALGTFFLTFDGAGHIVRYEGAVPVQWVSEGSLSPFRARVEYAFEASKYL